MKSKTVDLNKNIEEVVSDVKRDIIFYIMLHLKQYKTTLPETRYLAQDVLKAFPAQDIEDLIYKLGQLALTYQEARIVFIKYANAYYEEKKAIILQQVPFYINAGQLEQAIRIVKGGTYHV